MDQDFESFYREIYADLTVDREEAKELQEKIESANPPPDKLVKLRASVFKVGLEFLSEDDNENNLSLLRTMNAIVHALEMTCMTPKGSNEDSPFEESMVEEKYREIMSDMSMDRSESQELYQFFTEDCPVPPSKLIWTRATVFRIGSELLADDKETNTQLFRTINAIVHFFEIACLQPKPFELKMEIPENEKVEEIGLDASIEKAVQHLWDLDMNRLVPGDDYELNVQGGKKPYHKEDEADEPLFSKVDTREFQRPTYKTFIALLDNYSAETGNAEYVSDMERREVYAFLNAIMQTAPMQFCHKYCRENAPDKVPADLAGFKKLLHSMWFDLYGRSRGGRPDSSGFEHVFVGEVKNGEVSGFHNWIQFYLEEKKGTVDYRGYIKPRSYKDAQTNEDDHVLTIQFSWNGVEKMVGTSFIGVSPEFEMALYTMCFLVGGEQNTVRLDTGPDIFQLNVKVYKMFGSKIGTSYVEAKSHSDDE
eukprot:CAMPEP_0198280736 /NCGR_PEP_ID=MMETSP1449-20131203/746_1 /TAXON_ID=420275 /ORGANISM="Attheya septentrionalis, Strain CCMP2084" /LENGTH=478 /DNA_ID=CAMNT_0043976175 /DNA_START=98 /DNA_END=1534 /DNA_ORIENTATION=-